MENYAKKIALDHKLQKHSNKHTYPIDSMIKDFKYIGKTYDVLNESIAKNVPIPPSGEWLLDNYYLIEEQVDIIKKELTLEKYKTLPSVDGVSRIYIIAKELVNYTDANITENTIERFIMAYQTKKNLMMDELWIFPIMLKIALIEYIKKLCERITVSQFQKFKVESLIERIIKNKPQSEQRFYKYKNITICAEATSYVEYLLYVLKKYGNDGYEYINILENEINKIGTTTSDVIKVEHYDQALRRVSMGNSITSIRSISRFNWVHLFERINSIDKILKQDKWYSKLDFDTRNMYREEIKNIAKISKTSEIYVATKVIEICEDGEHIGKFLIGNDKEKLFKELGGTRGMHKQSITLKTFEYIIAIYLPTILFSILLAKEKFFIAIIPLSEIFVYIINRILSRTVKPQPLPKIEEISEDVNTFVVVPTLLNSAERVKNIFSSIERYYIGNEMDNLYFALLGDVSEVDFEKMSYDDEVITVGKNEAKRLNEKYGKEIFFFLYRRRVYNEKQGKWLGYERKRGMLTEFNSLLLTGNSGTFQVNTIGKEILDKKIKYVITLDADTELVLESAKKLIGIMEHPLNKPVIKDGIVTSGYGIVQPRVGISIESATSSIFSKILAGSGGIDIYSTAESNVYQDVFGEAIFTGKGIYNVEIYQKVLDGEIPDNAVLSHDLLEGSYVRCGLATDVLLIDGFPSRVNSYMVRQARWTRGDWQIIKWLFSKKINALSKYKIFDNLRRSLVDISLLVMFFSGYFLIPLLVIFFPFIAECIEKLFHKITSINDASKDYIKIKNKDYIPVIKGLKGSLYRCTLQLLFLPYKSVLLLEAIVVTIYRMTISKKHLLEWLTAADAEKVLGKDIKSFWREMLISPMIGFLLVESSLIYNSVPIEATFSLFLIWLTMPVISFLIGVENTRKTEEINSNEKEELMKIAKRTWQYFDDYMNVENNFIPPDNYQENRKEKVAKRTSSTNIGLGLLAIISANDLGFISKKEMLDRLSFSIETIENLKKYKGHLYNWYSTQTKEPLKPEFISTVDSGNFVGYLYVVREALDKYPEAKELKKKIEKIINDTDFRLLYDEGKNLFSVGYNICENKLVDSYYDLLASEARLASFVAIAKKDISYKHWFNLGRSLTTLDGKKGLVSWAGTMFEYFMPYIIMENFSHTLMDETYEFCIYSQKKYAKKLNIPWGISESAFYLQDLNYNYQYKAFGIPYLGVKRGLKNEVVVSPYSTIMTIDKNAKDVFKNIKTLKKAGGYGRYGFYDAIDYTPNRVGKKGKSVVKTYMAHHQALILLSINNFLNRDILKERFMKNQEIKTFEILLQERVPQNIIFTKQKKEKIETLKYRDSDAYGERVINNVQGIVNILSNDKHTLLINDNGEGYSTCEDYLITRYKDGKQQSNVIYIKDLENNEVWTNTAIPNLKLPDEYTVTFSSATCKFERSDNKIGTVTKISISPEDNIEIRKLEINNYNDVSKNLDIISYFEGVLSDKNNDIVHPAFNNLFLTVKRYKDACIVERRVRDLKREKPKYLIHFAFEENNLGKKFDFEINKEKIIGSGRTLENANIAMQDVNYENDTSPNPNTVVSYKTTVMVGANEKCVINYIYGFANTIEECEKLYEKYRSNDMIKRAFELAMSRSLVENKFLGHKVENIKMYNDIMSQVINGSESRKKYAKEIMENKLKQRDLWKFGISGDLPIILLKIKNVNEAENLNKLLKFIEYAKHKNIKIDLVVLDEEENSYEEYVKEKIYEIINVENVNFMINQNGGIHVIKKALITEDEEKLLYACSDVILP